MKILLAEHQPEVRSALKLLLEEVAGLEVSPEVTNTQELFQSISKETPSIILLEWELPGVSGEVAIRRIKQRYSRAILISLSTRDETGKAAIAAGADGFIRKGSLPQEVIATVIRCLESKYPVYE